MAPSKAYLWICLALCVAMGGSEVFYKKRGEEVVMGCGKAESNRLLEWSHNGVRLVKVMKLESRGDTETAKKARLIESKLKVPSLVMGDSGTYICNGQDKGNKVTEKHTVYVMSVTVSPSQTVLYSSELTMTFDIQDSNAKVQWMKPPGDKPHETSGKVITINSVTEADFGNWACQVKTNEWEETIVVDIVVLGPLKSPEEVNARPGSSADLTCSLPPSNHPYIEKGGWSCNTSEKLNFPALQGGPKWNGRNDSKVTFSDKKLDKNFTVTLNKVTSNYEGKCICSVTFKNGRNVSTAVMLKVEKTADSASGTGPRWLSVNRWIWVGAAAALVFLIALVVSIVLIHRRNKQMRRKVRKMKSMRQGLTATHYCQCDRMNRQPHPGKRERPPPLPRYQYDVMD